jgi:hypothetical protein
MYYLVILLGDWGKYENLSSDSAKPANIGSWNLKHAKIEPYSFTYVLFLQELH